MAVLRQCQAVSNRAAGGLVDDLPALTSGYHNERQRHSQKVKVKIVTSKEPLAKPQVRVGPDQISLAKQGSALCAMTAVSTWPLRSNCATESPGSIQQNH